MIKRLTFLPVSGALVLLISASAFGQEAIISTYVGTSAPFSGAQSIATFIGNPASVASDGVGGFYVASSSTNRIYYTGADGILTVVAGSGARAFGGDNGPALSAALSNPQGVAADALGNLFIADTGNNRVRKVTPAGVISTVAGTGTSGFSGDGGPATGAQLWGPLGLTVDAVGSLFIADAWNNRVRKVTSSGIINTVAGVGPSNAISGSGGFGGDGGPAAAAQLNYPRGVAVDQAGNLFIADNMNRRLRQVSSNGIISTIAGGGTLGVAQAEGRLATEAAFLGPSGVTVDNSGNAFFVSSSMAFKVSAAGMLTRIAGRLTSSQGFSGDGTPATNAQLALPVALSVDNAGSLLIADTSNFRIRKVSSDGVITTVAGSALEGFGGDGGPAGLAQLNQPSTVAIDKNGNLFIADYLNNRIRKVAPNGLITTVAGNGTAGFGGDGGPATAAQLRLPRGVAVDSSGNLFIGDSGNHRIRKVAADGVITTFAGSGTFGLYNGDGGPALAAVLPSPEWIAVDAAGDVYVAVENSIDNKGIRRISGGVINKLTPYSGPFALDSNGNLFFTDNSNAVTNPTALIKQSPNGTRTTMAQWLANNSRIQGMAVEPGGNLFVDVAVFGNQSSVWKITPDGAISTVVADPLLARALPSLSGDNGPATAALLNGSRGLAIDALGNLYIADTLNHRIRKVTFTAPPPITPFSLADRGGVALRSRANGETAVVGYARIQPDNGPTPAGVAIFGFRQNGVLVTEAGVPASPLLQSGRIYAEVNGPVNTGLAIANPNSQAAAVSFFFTGPNGAVSSGATFIPAKGQIASFLNQTPFNGGSSFTGAFTFNSSVPIAVIALRGLTNERGEFLITTLPVTDLSLPAAAGTVVFPHFAAGSGWTTEIVLVNAGNSALTGTVGFWDQSGRPATVVINGAPNTTFPYDLPPQGSRKLQASGAASLSTGSVRVIPAAGAPAPTGLAIFSFKKDGVTVTEAGVPAARAGTAFRSYVETSGVFGEAGSIQTGLAVANALANPATVTLELHRLDGSSAGLTGTIQVAGNSQAAMFLNQISGLESLQTPFQGVIRLSSPTPVSVVGLRGRYNERGDFLITTTPPVSETPVSAGPLFFPHIVDSGGYTTQFVIFSAAPGQPVAGAILLFSKSGIELNWALQ